MDEDNMNPIHTTQADLKSAVPLYGVTEDCKCDKECLEDNECECRCHKFGKGKTTTLIFPIEDFPKCNWTTLTQKLQPSRIHHSVNCNCKGTGYIVPKKEDWIRISKFELSDCSVHQKPYANVLCTCKCKQWDKFHLTSDAEVTSAYSLDSKFRDSLSEKE